MVMEESAAARAVAARSAGATPMPRSPTQTGVLISPKQRGSGPQSSSNIPPPSSLPPIKRLKPAPEKKSTLFTPAVLARKRLFDEKLMKDRLNARDFAYERHNSYYKDLTKPEKPDSLSYANCHRKEFWRTDVDQVLKREEEQRRARQKELIGIWTSEEAWRRHRATKMREMRYDAYTAMNERMQKVGCRGNLSGAPHINIITREALGLDTPVAPPTYSEDVSKNKAIQRKLLLRAKNSGARNYNILNWEQNPPGPELPPWPEKPTTPPPPPLPKSDSIVNSSKGALSYARLFGPFGCLNEQ